MTRSRQFRNSLLGILCFALIAGIPLLPGIPPSAEGQALSGQFQAGTDVHVHLFVPGGHGGPDNPPGRVPPGKRGPGGRKGPRGPGRTSQNSSAAYEAAGQHLLKKMQQNGVERALLMPPPRTRENADLQETTHLLELAARHPGRFFVAAGGDVLNPIIHEVAPAKVSPIIRNTFTQTAEGLVARGIKAFGEMSPLHFSFNDKHVFEEVSPDHPLFLLLADLAAKHGIPIDLHMEAVQQDMPFPAGFDRRSKNNPPFLKENISGLENLLAHNRQARIVWQHIGWDNTGHLTVDLLRTLLKRHPNLFLALRLENRLRTMAGTPMPNRFVDPSGTIKPEWLALFREFPDRFTLGTDEFCGPENAPGLFGNQQSPQSFTETWQFAGSLPADLAAKFARENAAVIYGM